MLDRISKIKLEYLAKIAGSASLADLDALYLALFGKSGVITLIPKEFPKIEKAQLASIVPAFTAAKNELEQSIERKRTEIRERNYSELNNEKIDLTVPFESAVLKGRLHPITIFENEIADSFKQIGFSQFDAPHIDTDYFNFEVLNIPEEHPARDLWDTLYIDKSNLKERNQNLLLRTHTSNTQVRIMQNYKPPIRMMIMGRCFRYENLDARHEHTFQQFEIVLVEKGLSMANLQYLSEYLLQQIFGSEIKVRLRPKYYPFVEPGAGVDGLCIFCKGKGCKICGGSGWFELAGAGMIHPTVLKNGGVDPNEYSGIAWGFGTYRVAMLKYGVEDMRIFNSGDLRFLKGDV